METIVIKESNLNIITINYNEYIKSIDIEKNYKLINKNKNIFYVILLKSPALNNAIIYIKKIHSSIDNSHTILYRVYKMFNGNKKHEILHNYNELYVYLKLKGYRSVC